jgi:hypothetical protein
MREAVAAGYYSISVKSNPLNQVPLPTDHTMSFDIMIYEEEKMQRDVIRFD